MEQHATPSPTPMPHKHGAAPHPYPGHPSGPPPHPLCAGACNLRLQLYTEVCDARTLVHLPANAMRNRALQMAQTEVSEQPKGMCHCPPALAAVAAHPCCRWVRQKCCGVPVGPLLLYDQKGVLCKCHRDCDRLWVGHGSMVE